MTLLFMDSTDFLYHPRWDNAFYPMAAKWGIQAYNRGSSFEVSPTLWGSGAHCIRLAPACQAITAPFTINNNAGPDTIYMGFRMRLPNGLPTGLSALFEYGNPATTGQWMDGPGLYVDNAGVLSARPFWAPGTVWAASSSGAVPGSGDPYLEYKVVMTTNLTGGSVEAKVNGSVVLSGSGFNTLYPGLAQADTMRVLLFYALTGSREVYLRDLYVCNGSGSRNNTYLGDTPMGVLLPRADGFYHDFSPNGIHYPLIADTQPDVSTIVSIPFGHTPPKRESYIYNPPVNSGGRIAGVSVLIAQPSQYGNGLHVRPFFRIGGTDYEGTDRYIGQPGGGFQNRPIWGSVGNTLTGVQHQIWETNPATGTDWTYSDLAALEAGIRTVDPDNYGITQVLIETTLPGSSYTPPTDTGYGYAAVIGAGDTGVQGLSPAGLQDSGSSVRSALSGSGGVPATVQEDT